MKEKLWNWGHLETSHNKLVSDKCRMTLEEFAKEYGIENSFVVSYGGNIQPPFGPLADRLSVLKEIKWSILGDGSTPIPDDELGFTNEIIELAKDHPNITGGVIDDFFSPARLKRFPPEILKKIQKKLNANGLDFWAVLYAFDLLKEENKDVIKEHYDCFDGITYWIWSQKDIDNVNEHINNFFNMFPDCRKMLGIYLWDYPSDSNGPIEIERFKKHLFTAKKLLDEGKIEGIVFCSGCIGDAELETNKFLKEYLKTV